jgi:hypothetical protein
MQLLSFVPVFWRSRLRLSRRRNAWLSGAGRFVRRTQGSRRRIADPAPHSNGLDPGPGVECDTSLGWIRGGSDLDMGKILLARSATTDFDEQGRIVGTLDLPINVRGQAEIAALAQDFRRFPLVTIYAAPNESARETARQLGELLSVKVRILKDLKNLDFGLWQGLQTAEVRRKHPKLYKQWEESPRGICPPAGETTSQIAQAGSQTPAQQRGRIDRTRPSPVVVRLLPERNAD